MKSIVLFATILRIILITAIISFAIIVNAQSVAVNTTGNSADASAMLDISSNSKGFLPPRMTTLQRTGISSPANGLMVFDTDTKSLWMFSTLWKEIGATGNFSLPYSGTSTSNSSIFFVTNTASSLASSAIFGRSNNGSGFFVPSSTGVWGDNSTGVGVAGTSNNVGVFGMTNSNDANGIGVKGINSSDNNAAVTGENNLSGGGIKGVFAGPQNSFGYGVIGETGKNGNIGVAGKFISNNPADPTNTLWALNYGSGPGFTVTMNNGQNNESAIKVNHTGTGKLLDLGGNGDFTVANNGNTVTSGTVTVKGNKGIVRNSSATQMRIETVNATYNSNTVISSLGSVSINVFFTTTFSSAPSVYIGNITVDGGASYLTTYVKNVTAVGCTLVIRNTTDALLGLSPSTWKLVAIGAE